VYIHLLVHYSIVYIYMHEPIRMKFVLLITWYTPSEAGWPCFVRRGDHFFHGDYFPPIGWLDKASPHVLS